MMGIDAAMGTKIVPSGHGIELIDRELVGTFQDIQTGYIR
jgi:hypothetical protein